MTLPKVLGGCLLAVTLAVLAYQKSAISQARQQNEIMRQAQEEAQRLGHENETIPQLRTEREEVESLRNANRDLLRLRNEVRQLRGQSGEIEALRKENQRLASEVQSLAQGKLPRLSNMQGYVAKESWSNAGFATPEQALQTFFWALRLGDLRQVAECISPEMRPHFDREFQNMSELEQKKAFEQGFGQLARIGGYRMAQKEQVSEDEALLGVQAAAGGMVMKMVFRRFGNEWKFHDVLPVK